MFGTVVSTAVLCTLFIQSSLAAPEADLITSLPGLSKQPPFKMYSGYLNADDTGDKNLHYWFVESSSNPRSDPVVLWLNGGPGCSSLLGLLTENGPFQFSNNGSLQYNPFTWNQAANMLYLEAPAGVGFSYSLSGDYSNTNDNTTAIGNSKAVQNFFAKFPEFRGHDFYITGESYGGIYVPTLVGQILDVPSIKLKGFAVGNGYFNAKDNDDSLIYFAYYHGLISDGDWLELVQQCCTDGAPERCNFDEMALEAYQCQQLVTKIQTLVWVSGLDVYNLYSECDGGVNTGFSTVYQKSDGKFHTTYFGWPFSGNEQARMEKEKLKLIPRNKLKVEISCTDFTTVNNYLTREDVKTALHISDHSLEWTPCSSAIDYQKIYTDTTPFFLKAMEHKLRMMVYNGDVDMACNFLGGEWFVDRLNLDNPSDRKMWYYTAADGTRQVAGFIKTFDLMSLVTVKGSGHMVPSDKPRPALEMFINFIQDKPFLK